MSRPHYVEAEWAAPVAFYHKHSSEKQSTQLLSAGHPQFKITSDDNPPHLHYSAASPRSYEIDSPVHPYSDTIISDCSSSNHPNRNSPNITNSRNFSPLWSPLTMEVQIQDGLCPLLVGQSDKCIPEICGAEAPCKSFWTLQDVEDCAESTWSESRLVHEFTLESLGKQSRQTATQRKQTAVSLSPGPESLASSTSTEGHRDKRSMPAKQAHSVVERRYRENLNSKITELHRILQSIQPEDPKGTFGLSRKLRKNDVLVQAVDYINQSQLDMRYMTEEIQRLNLMLEARPTYEGSTAIKQQR